MESMAQESFTHMYTCTHTVSLILHIHIKYIYMHTIKVNKDFIIVSVFYPVICGLRLI